MEQPPRRDAGGGALREDEVHRELEQASAAQCKGIRPLAARCGSCRKNRYRRSATAAFATDGGAGVSYFASVRGVCGAARRTAEIPERAQNRDGSLLPRAAASPEVLHLSWISCRRPASVGTCGAGSFGAADVPGAHSGRAAARGGYHRRILFLGGSRQLR